MLFLEFELTFKRDCLPYATFSMACELQGLRQPTGAGILLNLVTEYLSEYTLPPKSNIDVPNFWPHFGPVSAPFRPHYKHYRIMTICAYERTGPKLQNEWSFVKIG